MRREVQVHEHGLPLLVHPEAAHAAVVDVQRPERRWRQPQRGAHHGAQDGLVGDHEVERARGLQDLTPGLRGALPHVHHRVVPTIAELMRHLPPGVEQLGVLHLRVHVPHALQDGEVCLAQVVQVHQLPVPPLPHNLRRAPGPHDGAREAAVKGDVNQRVLHHARLLLAARCECGLVGIALDATLLVPGGQPVPHKHHFLLRRQRRAASERVCAAGVRSQRSAAGPARLRRGDGRRHLPLHGGPRHRLSPW
mmetsp:Transcript_27772/g.71472  ORF Transcript_27772/g.71472 Transcript_27772/m.71472 type:complete len:251 (+) Transcript_27772:1305-2057(+)